MRAIVLAALAVSLTAPLAYAQEAAPAPAAPANASDIGPNADRDFWCAAAYGMLSYSLKQTGDDAGADTASANMQTLFQGLVVQMQGKGLQKEQFDTLVSQYTAVTMNPFAETSFTREQCDGAVTEAKAAMPVAPAEPNAAATTTTAP
jgi:hypothetical protein